MFLSSEYLWIHPTFKFVRLHETLLFQVKQLYQKIQSQAESLKGLWVAKLNLKGRSALATAEDLQEFERKRDEVLSLVQETKTRFLITNFP